MKSFFRKYEVWIFLISIVIANAVFVTGVVNGSIPLGVYSLGRFALLGGILFGLVFLLRGLPGVWKVLEPMVEWRRSPWLYLFAIGWTVTLCLAVLFVKGITTGDFLTSAELMAGIHKISHPRLVLTLIVSSFVGEMVWVSYAIRQLTSRFTHFIAALIVGSVWTAWWLPMSVHNFGIIPDLPLAALWFNQMGIAAMCAFVYHHTKSGFLVLLMQIVFNATILVMPITPSVGGAATYWAFAMTYFSAAVILFLKFGPWPLVGNARPAQVCERLG